MSVRRTGLVAAVGSAAALTLVVGAPAHGQSAFDCFAANASAAADGIRVAFHGAGVLPLTDDLDAAGPTASALVGGGASGAVAGSPYSSFVYSLPGLAGVDPSTYPLAVLSQYPTKPHASADYGALTLDADSAELSSTATASGGGANAAGTDTAAGATTEKATAQCSADTGAASIAGTSSDALSVAGGTLRIGAIDSTASVTVGPDGISHVSTDLHLGNVTVAGQTVEINDRGLSSPAGPVPLPDPAGSVLASQGIQLTYVAAAKDSDGRGVTAPGLQIAVTEPLSQLSGGQIGRGPSTVTYTFGRATARALGTAATSLTSGPAPPSSATPSTGVDGGSTSAPVVGATTPTSGPGGELLAEPPAGVAAGPPGGQEPAIAAPAGSGATATASMTHAALRQPIDIDWELVYLAVAVGAGAVVGGSLLLRYLGERLGWM